MPSDTHTAPVSKKMLWVGRILSAIPVLFLVFDGVAKLIKPASVVEATVRLGYPESIIRGLGILSLVCTVVYAVPRTSVLGAILLTGYLGGASATHVRIGAPLFPMLFPSLVGALICGGLFLRDAPLRTLILYDDSGARENTSSRR
jgi:DoxX-like family